MGFWEKLWYNILTETAKQNGASKMTYSRATEILNFTTPKSLAANAALAQSYLERNQRNFKLPLRYKVAAQVLINAAK